MDTIVALITQFSPEAWSAFVYVAATLGICALMLIGSALLGGKSSARARGEPFESGVVAASPEQLRLSAKFYLVAMFFVIFDVEALFLYAWAVSVKESGWLGLAEVAVFITILGASVIYLARIGALDWTPHQKKRRAAAAAAASRTFSQQHPPADLPPQMPQAPAHPPLPTPQTHPQPAVAPAAQQQQQ